MSDKPAKRSREPAVYDVHGAKAGFARPSDRPVKRSREPADQSGGRIGIFGSALSYAGSSPRITSEPIGRDINPLGRSSGMALVGGQLNLGRVAPRLPLSKAAGGTGSSVNNCGGVGGCGLTLPPNNTGGGFTVLGGDLEGWPEPEPKSPYSPPRDQKWPYPQEPEFPSPEQPPGDEILPGGDATKGSLLEGGDDGGGAGGGSGGGSGVPQPGVNSSVTCDPTQICCCDKDIVALLKFDLYLCLAVTFKTCAVACEGLKTLGPLGWGLYVACLAACAAAASCCCT